ncbi:MAG: nitroreductase [Clostridiales bacterium]|nr:nitroreductase [Clostridiales bacterium]
MNMDFSIEEAVRKRRSVRNYKEQEVEADKRQAIESFAYSLENPFGEKVNFYFLDYKDMKNEQKLGTYGVIKGAGQYIGATVKSGPMALEAIGYEVETLILYLTRLGLGTCWLGGTFDRKGFANAMDIEEDEMFPVVLPYGYAADKKHMKEFAMRKMVKADSRKGWEQLFLKNDFRSPLPRTEAGDLEFPLEMVRLGPSASNKQPWRILLKDNACHFYENKEPGYSKIFPYDIQRIDMGIAAAHFDFAVKEKNIKGHFDTSCRPETELPEHTEYIISWVRE